MRKAPLTFATTGQDQGADQPASTDVCAFRLDLRLDVRTSPPKGEDQDSVWVLNKYKSSQKICQEKKGEKTTFLALLTNIGSRSGSGP